MKANLKRNDLILALARTMYDVLDESKWMELGYLTDSIEVITEHPRLLRSMRFGDEDYLGCIYQVLPSILETNDENLDRIATYVDLEKHLQDNHLGLYNLIFDSRESRSVTDTDIPTRLSVNNQTCFVIMPFGEPVNSYYKPIIASAISQINLQPLRADEIAKPGAIIQQIWEGIRDAKVCIAELTGQNSNVMYEFGLAHALHKPVVTLVQSIGDIPFDLRHLRHIVYSTQSIGWEERLRMQLATMLLSTLADPKSGIVFKS